MIYEKAARDKNAKRPELKQCSNALLEGHTLVVLRSDRLRRSLPDLVLIVADLKQRGIGFESLTENFELAVQWAR